MLSHFSHVRLFVIPWTITCQAPLPMGFSRQEHWSGLPCPLPGDLPNTGKMAIAICTGRWVLYHQCQLGNPTQPTLDSTPSYSVPNQEKGCFQGDCAHLDGMQLAGTPSLPLTRAEVAISSWCVRVHTLEGAKRAAGWRRHCGFKSLCTLTERAWGQLSDAAPVSLDLTQPLTTVCT